VSPEIRPPGRAGLTLSGTSSPSDVFPLLSDPAGTLYNPVEGSPNLYSGELEWTSFDYRVSVAVCAVFVALFSISLSESHSSRRVPFAYADV
jgi:hypothetical protein